MYPAMFEIDTDFWYNTSFWSIIKMSIGIKKVFHKCADAFGNAYDT
jgi:hypothetical protein